MTSPEIQEQAVLPPSAHVVGHAFADQYYTILQQSPGLVHRFYQDVSKLGRVEDGGVMSSTSTMKAIDEKIQSFGSLKADIKHVDAQESHNGGVIVLVTGFMIDVNDSRRGFTQTFFLAPQDKGYFVLNDIFRYMEDYFRPCVKHDDGIDLTEPSQEETAPLQENHISNQPNGVDNNPAENGEISVVPVEEVQEKEEEEPIAEVIDEAPNESHVVIKSNVKVEAAPAPKTSYASIVRKDSPSTSFYPDLPKSVPKMQEKPNSVAPDKAPMTVAPVSSAVIDDGNNQEHEGEGFSIFIKNLPINVSYGLVEEEFKRFGPIKSGGIQICNSKGFYFGFVEFEVAGAARSAIQASPVRLGSRAVVVEEKKSTYSRVNNTRGRFPGRGSGFRADGGGERESYVGGQGYGQGENNRNDCGNRGSDRGYQSRGSEGYHQRSDRMGNEGSRMNRGGGSSFGTTRGPKVPAQA